MGGFWVLAPGLLMGGGASAPVVLGNPSIVHRLPQQPLTMKLDAQPLTWKLPQQSLSLPLQ